jgi:uncharacterized membrane protein YkvA (DUF1232 family)
MKSQTGLKVGDLRKLLDKREISPEVFAKEVGLSHMTIRRWLKKPDTTTIPSKYQAALGVHLGKPSETRLDVSKMMDEVKKNGNDFRDIETLDQDLNEKLKSERFDKVIVSHCKRLFQAATSAHLPLSSKAIAIGALLYFINPIDLIPDHIPVIGYMDDLAVLALAIEQIFGSKSS